MTKRIAILTWLYNKNYGTLLQAYALQHFLKKMSYEVENINFKPTAKEKVLNLFQSKNSFSLFKEKYDILLAKRNGDSSKRAVKNQRIDQFLKENFTLTETFEKAKLLTELSGKYDAYICGSDQIWSPMLLNPVYYFDFLSERDKKIAYACSFGLSKIPDNKKAVIKQYLSHFTSISVRENSGVKIVEDLIGKRAQLAVDPTILISIDEWSALAKEPEVKEDYIFVYLLSHNKEYEEIALQISRNMNCQIVIVPIQREHYNFPGVIIEDAGPQEWLGLIKNAKAIVTDSFHGCIFSLIFQKNFYVGKRFKDNSVKSQNSRIYTLLEMYDCNDCLISGVDDINEKNNYNWNEIKEKLEHNSKQSLEWLIDNLNGIDYEQE